MTQTFKSAYPSTRCIIDYTKIFCQTPSSLSSENSLSSSYKYHVRYKGLFGIAPTRAKSFISELYAGCNSPKESFRKKFHFQQKSLEGQWFNYGRLQIYNGERTWGIEYETEHSFIPL